MSYLSLPRLHFSGKFQADPSTVNNDPEHFNTNHFQSNYTLPEGATSANGWWNPGGTGAWKIYGCTVQSVMYKDGTICDDPLIDPIVGTSLNGADSRVSGKMVDLDPEQQMVSEIWGFQVLLGNIHKGYGLKGDFETAAFGDIWVRFPSGRADSFFGAFYQSVLTIKEWANNGGSRYLKELEQESNYGGTPEQVSIKFNVDGFDDDSTSPNFTFGRIVGSIGTQISNDPKHFIPGRFLNKPQQSPLNLSYAILKDNKVFLDLGNSLPTQSVGGPLSNQGQLYLAVLPATGNPVLLGEINYQLPGWYEKSAGIISLPLSDDQIELVENNPLAIVQSTILAPINATGPLLAEDPGGLFVRADRFVFRMDPGNVKTATFSATRFGQPFANESISLIYDPTVMQGQATQGPIAGPQLLGQPQSAFQFPTTITTNENGIAELTMTASDPGNPRKYIDGQLYGIAYQAGNTPPPVGSIQNGSQIISAIVYSGYEVPEKPTWIEHVQPIFQKYADLYPVMKPIVDLSNYSNVVEKLYILKNVFSMEISNPNYMPVTRDLSGAKREMIRKWLDYPLYMNLDSVDDIRQALQIAIELEHATIPPYLCALYSIKPNQNTEVAGLIKSVVLEEMLHMAQAANLLISIGGTPRIGHARFIPQFPGGLPGGLRSGLTVRLRRCSIDQIRECFMSIEEPEKIIEIKRTQLKLNEVSDKVRQFNSYTIGAFYDEIQKSLTDLSNQGKITFGNEEKQVSEWHGPGTLHVITSLDDVKDAINEIKEQGEGTSITNPDDPDHELSHYYKFAEIVEGKYLVKDGDGYAYKGARISFDPNGVWPMMDDPNSALYPDGSRAQILSNQFSETYQALLNGLNKTFNGEPAFLREAVGLMYSLEIIAVELMKIPSGLNDGTTAGPSFQAPVRRG